MTAVRGRIALWVATLLASTAHAQQPAPAALVESTARELAAAVAQEREQLRTDTALQADIIERVLRPRFDLETSVELILRDRWRSANTDERREVLDAFYGYLVNSYADALHYFNGQTITLLPDQPPTLADSYRVRSILRMHDGETFELQFYLRHEDSEWQIVDLIVDGVSYVRTYRTDFGSIVRQGGLQALVDWLQKT